MMPAATPLDDLLALTETLQARIESHDADLRGSEALTRYALIDPLLRELGWDTGDPTQVVPEFPVSDGRADYALVVGGESQIMIEAKRLGGRLDNAAKQGIQYCMEKGTRYFVLTDGAYWRLYETHRPVPLERKLVVEFNLQGPRVAFALAALTLCRPQVEARSIGSPPATLDHRSETDEPMPRQSQRTHPEPSRAPAETTANGWHQLASFTPVPYSRPAEVRFPDSERENVMTWAELSVRIVAWLERQGHLSHGQLPVQIGRKYVVARRPVHPSGVDFGQPKKAGSFFVETQYSAAQMLKNIARIIEWANCQSSQFHVRLRD